MISSRVLVSLFSVTLMAFPQTVPIVNPPPAPVVPTDPTLPPPPTPLPQEKLEVEQVEVYRFGAGPATIQRKPGKFYLSITNRSKDLDAVFSLQPADSSMPVLVRIGGPHAWQGAHKLAALVDASVPGVWLLKATATGQTLCTITTQPVAVPAVPVN